MDSLPGRQPPIPRIGVRFHQQKSQLWQHLRKHPTCGGVTRRVELGKAYFELEVDVIVPSKAWERGIDVVYTFETFHRNLAGEKPVR